MFSGLTIVRNAIENGYPIAEVLDCLRVICDEIIVLDGGSTDGTYEYLCTQRDIKIHQDPWNLAGKDGLEFARVTNIGISKCKGDYIFYLQADELLHHNDIVKIPELLDDHNSVAFNMLHIRYNLDYRLDGDYDRAIRVIKNNGKVYSYYDAFTFSGQVDPIYQSSIPVYHVGYVFIKNILQKMMNHSKHFYVGQAPQTNRRQLAEKYLAKIAKGEELPSNLQLASILEPEYRLIRHETNIPDQLNRLIGATEYTLP